MTLTQLAAKVRALHDYAATLPYACPYNRLARKRLDAAWQLLCEGLAQDAAARIEDATIHLNYSRGAAQIATLRSEALAEARRPICA